MHFIWSGVVPFGGPCCHNGGLFSHHPSGAVRRPWAGTWALTTRWSSSVRTIPAPLPPERTDLCCTPPVVVSHSLGSFCVCGCQPPRQRACLCTPLASVEAVLLVVPVAATLRTVSRGSGSGACRAAGGERRVPRRAVRLRCDASSCPGRLLPRCRHRPPAPRHPGRRALRTVPISRGR